MLFGAFRRQGARSELELRGDLFIFLKELKGNDIQ